VWCPGRAAVNERGIAHTQCVTATTYKYILQVSPSICADAILYGEQSRGECIILLSAYNNTIHGVVPLTLPRHWYRRPRYTVHITRPCVYAHAHTRFRPDKRAPFYAAAEAAYYSLSVPPDPPLTTTHNIRLEKSIDVITRGRGALAAPPNPRHVVSTCKFHAVPIHETCKCDTPIPLLSSPTIHNSIT